jgi:hypothetical protein
MPNQTDEKSIVLKQIKNLPMASGITETILNIFKATLATAPFCGGIASLINDYIPSARFQRLEAFAQQIADDLLKLADKVNESYIQTDDFAFLFEKSFRGVAENPQVEKINAFRGVLINSAVRSDYSEEEKEYFMTLVNTFSALHIRILRFMAYPKQYLSDSGIPENRITGGFSSFFPVAIPGVSSPVIESAFGDLHQYGLISTDKTIFHTMTSGQGLHLLGNRVSEFGLRFIQLCISPAS